MIGNLSARHRAVDFRDFLDEIDRQVEPGLAVHLLCDNLAPHKAPVVHAWLLAHPRFVLYFTPIYSSWISQVERGFAELERRRTTVWSKATSAPWMLSRPLWRNRSRPGTTTPGGCVHGSGVRV
jgi:transposase